MSVSECVYSSLNISNMLIWYVLIGTFTHSLTRSFAYPTHTFVHESGVRVCIRSYIHILHYDISKNNNSDNNDDDDVDVEDVK